MNARLAHEGPSIDRSARRFKRWLIVILSAALLVRIGFLILFPQTLSLKTSGYDAYAVHLLEGRGFTRFEDRTADTDLPPLYPFLLAAIFASLGRGALQVGVVQIAFDGLTILLLHRIGRRVGGEAVGLLSAAFYGFYPYLIYQNLTVNDTSIFILLLVAGIELGYRVEESRSARQAAAMGLVLALAALTKPMVGVVWLLLGVWWLIRLGRRDGVRLGLISGVTLAAVIAPWVIRNSLVDGEIVFISTNGGSNLHQGNNACVVDYLKVGWDAQWVDCLAQPPPGLNEAELDRWHRQQALDYLWENPDQWTELLATKFWVLWSPALRPTSVPPGAVSGDDPVLIYSTPAFQWARTIHVFYFAPLLALGVLGIALAWRARRPIGPLLGVLAAVTVVYLVFHPSTRYRSPADPFLFVFSAFAVVRLWVRARAPRPHNEAS